MNQAESAGRCSPLGAVCRGAAAGLTATLMLSALSRVLPGMSLDPKRGNPEQDDVKPPPPRDPFNRAQVEEWQQRSQAPAAFAATLRNRESQEIRPGNGGNSSNSGNSANSPASRFRHAAIPGNGGAVTPASALEKPQSPGPEGIAEQFAFKVASAIFDVDITPVKRPVGLVTHLSYGSFWGAVYGLLRTTLRQPPLLMGSLFGLGVWAVGPATLVPAMKIMGKPNEEPPIRTAMMIAGHMAYGVALAEVFEWESNRVAE